jgi:hypothetical protein
MVEVNSMCTECEFDEKETPAFFDAFAYDEKSMDYYDGPLAGWMTCNTCHRWFAFDCAIIIETMLWHWSMIPSEKTGDARQAILNAAKDREGWWLSVVEDRRADGQRHRAVRIRNTAAKPAIGVTNASSPRTHG